MEPRLPRSVAAVFFDQPSGLAFFITSDKIMPGGVAMSTHDKEVERWALRVLERTQAVIQSGHFVYKSRRHGSVYVNKWSVLPNPLETGELCRLFVDHFAGSGPRYVVGPAHGGAVLAFETARRMSLATHHTVMALCAAEDPKTGERVIHGGVASMLQDRGVLVVEDILTTGATARKTVEAVRAAGGRVAAVAAICNRGGVTAEALGGIPELYALVDLSLESWAADECPLCRDGVAVREDFGYGREFLAERKGV